MKQNKQLHIKLFAISLLLLFAGLLVAQAAASNIEAPTTISEEEAIAIATSGQVSEIGENDFRISFMGGDELYDAGETAVVYNPINNEYLVVWQGDDNTNSLVDEELEIFGQRVDATTGQEVGPNDFRISDMGTDGDVDLEALNPAVAHDSVLNQYLVVWEGDDDTSPLADEDFEIFGQLLAADGTEIGSNDFRISEMGAQDGSTDFPAYTPAIAYNAAAQEYLVVWEGSELSINGTEAAVEIEIFGQRINATNGQPVGTNDFRISDMGPNVNDDFEAFSPAITYNSLNNEYLVVWTGDDDSGSLVNGEREIFGQLLTADGSEIGDNDFRISQMGPDQNTIFGAYAPAVTHNPNQNLYLVVWNGDDDSGQLIDNEFEIYGQLLDDEGAETGLDDFRISSMGPEGDNQYVAFGSSVSFSPSDGRYLVTWWGSDNPNSPFDYEIFGQVIAPGGIQLDPDDFRLSDMGPDGDVAFSAVRPAVACQTTAAQCLVAWHGEDNLPPLIANEDEIFGQLVQTNGTEIGSNDFRISDMGGDNKFDGFEPDVAYNSKENEYLVVWSGDDNSGTLVDGETEVFGRRIDAATGQPLSNHFRISSMGLDGVLGYPAYSAAVAYNANQNEYLVVWSGDTNILTGGEFEIYGQLLNAAGEEIGVNDFRISDVGPTNDPGYDALFTAVVHNSKQDQYLVVWNGEDNVNGLVQSEFEIFGQLLESDGTEIGVNDFRISHMGPDQDAAYGASSPALTYNPTEDQYLVVWTGDDDSGELVNNEFEVFGQLLNAAGGEEFSDDFRISDMGNDGEMGLRADEADVTYNPTLNQYLVVWHGYENLDSGNKQEVYGQLLDATGGETGNNDFPISDNELGEADDATQAKAIYNAAENRYLVVWSQATNDDLDDTNNELFGQLLNLDGSKVDTNDSRLSDMGPEDEDIYSAIYPAVACQTTDSTCLVVWQGDDDLSPLIDDEYEIFGQRLNLGGTSIYLPFIVNP